MIIKNYISNKLKKKKTFQQKKKKICEICGCKNCIDLINLGRVGKNCNYNYLPVSFCNYCELRFLNPRPTDEYFKHYYTSSYRKKKK